MDGNVKKIIENYSEYWQVSENTLISELEIDSLQFVALLVDLELYYGAEMDDEELDFTIYQTVADVINVFENRHLGRK